MSDTLREIPPAWRMTCEALSIKRGDRTVLQRIDLTLEPGECLSLIGPNGAGKTTLMLAMLGLLPPAGGSVRINDTPLSRIPARTRGTFASYVPQTVERIPAFHVYDVVASGRFPHVAPLQPLSRDDHAIVRDVLDRCGLTALADRPINELSGGERQKTMIAAAIAQDAQIMFLDEPSTALDPAYQNELVRLLREWHAKGRAIVLISHDLHLPTAIGGRIVALREGRVVADGHADEILTPPALDDIYSARFEMAQTADGRRVVMPAWW